MATQREILFILKMQNQSQQAIGELRSQLASAAAGLNAVTGGAGRLASARGPVNVTKDIDKMAQQAALANQRLLDIQTIIADINNAGLEFDGTAYGEALRTFREGLASGEATIADIEGGNAEEVARMMDFRRRALEEMGIAYDGTGDAAMDAARRAAEAEKLAKKGIMERNKALEGTTLMYRRLKQLAGAAAAFLAGNAIIREADAWKNLTGQLRLVTKDEQNLLAVREAIVDVANETYSDLEATSSLYVKLAQRASQLGRSQQQMIDLTRTFSQAMQVGGSTAQEAAAATRQFAQAVAAGSLRGDELNSIIENAPGLAMAFEEGLRAMGKEVTSLKSYIADANPTVRELLDALDTQVAIVEDKFKKLPTTVSQGMQVLSNGFTEFVGKLDEASKSTDGISKFLIRLKEVMTDERFIESVAKLANIIGKVLLVALNTLATIIEFVADNIDILIPLVAGAAAAFAAWNFSNIITGLAGMVSWVLKATVAFKAFTIALLTNPLTWIALLLAAVTAAIVYFGNKSYEVNGSVVSGWQVLKAVITGTIAAVVAGVTAWVNNLKAKFNALITLLKGLGNAFKALLDGDFSGAFEIARDAAGEFALEILKIGPAAKSAADASREAFRDAFNNSITNSAIKNAQERNKDKGGIIDDEVLDVPLPKADKDTDDAVKKAQDAIKAIKERTQETREAIKEQERMNAAVLEGPRALRALNVELAYERELRQQLKTLTDAGVGEDERKILAEAAATEAANLERTKQIESLNEMVRSMDVAIATRRREIDTQMDSIKILFATGDAQRELSRAQQEAAIIEEYISRLREEEYDTTEQYAEALKRATAAAREFASVQFLMSDTAVVADLIDSTRTAAEKAAIEYGNAKTSFDNWMNSVDPDIVVTRTSDAVARAREALENLRPPTDMWDAVTQGLRQFGKESEVTFLDIKDLARDSFGRIGDAVSDLVVDGKANFKELARAIIADIARMIVQALIFRAIMSVFGGGTPIPTGMSAGNGGVGSFALKHSGGIAGMTRAMKTVNPAVFAGAQRYHTGGIAGLKPGEVPIIAKKGEAVMPTVRLPNGQLGVQASGGTGAFAPNININIGGGRGGMGGGGDNMSPEQQAKLATLLQDEMSIFLQRKFEEWNRPGGQLDTAVRQRR